MERGSLNILNSDWFGVLQRRGQKAQKTAIIKELHAEGKHEEDHEMKMIKIKNVNKSVNMNMIIGGRDKT